MKNPIKKRMTYLDAILRNSPSLQIEVLEDISFKGESGTIYSSNHDRPKSDRPH